MERTFLFVVVCSFMALSFTEIVEKSKCVKCCEDKKDGDYQSCRSCHVYVTCSNGFIYDNRPCPADLVWDDKLKRCNYNSSTCPGNDAILKGSYDERCIKSCKGRKDGDYQSCNGCHVFATCSNGILYDNRACPAGLLWDDDLKRCSGTSKTCPGERKDMDVKDNCRCIKSCKGRKDGDYQSCISCRVYATCSNGRLYDNRPCPGDLVWDDNLKRCDYKSGTCK